MKVAINLLSIILLLVAMIIGLVSSANHGSLDKPIKIGLQYYFSLCGMKAKFYDFRLKNGQISASSVNIKAGNGTIHTKDLKLDLILLPDYSLSIKLLPSNIEISDKDANKMLTTSVEGMVNINFNGVQKINATSKKIEIAGGIQDINRKPLEEGSMNFSYSKLQDNIFIDAKIQFGESLWAELKSDENSNNIHLRAENIPVLFYKIADKIIPNNGLLDFLRNSIHDGYINNADIKINPNSFGLSKDSMSGTARIVQLDYKYDDAFPVLKSMNVGVKIEGKQINFIIDKAYSSDIALTDGTIDMFWNGINDTTLYIKAKGEGATKGLVDFIPTKEQISMKKANIDLNEIKGSVNTQIYIEVPLKPSSKNLYNITAEIPNASLNIFKDNAILRKANISGIFDGKQVRLHGVGKLNNFNTDLRFIYNVEDNGEFNHKLDVKTDFKTRSEKEKKITFITLLGGSSVVDIEYINKDSVGYVTVDSDISQLELYFDKLGIRKKRNSPARIKIDGLFDDPTKGIIGFHVQGDDDLSIKGIVDLQNNEVKIDLEEIKSRETDISGKVHMFQDEIIAQLSGKTLDLSDADMLQFLEKERDSGDSKLKINIDKVRLKNNIWLDDFRLLFECDSDRCFSGYIDSKIGSRDVEMLLTAEDDKEEWLIKCGNTGALLKGLDVYDSIKSGTMVLKISTSRKEVRSGEIIPILDGTFTLDRFKLQDTPSITRLVSFASIPGLIGGISGNKDIFFSGMNGNFSFEDRLLKINNSFAKGPYFDFNLKGSIDTKNREMDITGYVNPELYGFSSVIGSIPIIGRIFNGNNRHRGLVSGAYSIQDKY